MKSLTLILLISLIYSINSLQSTVKKIYYGGVTSNSCGTESDKYIINVLITSEGFTQEEKIKIRLDNPKYIDVECTVPVTDDTTKTGQIMGCEINTAIYPLKSGDLVFPETLNLPDIEVDEYEGGTLSITEDCHPIPDLTFTPSTREEPEYSCNDHYFTIKGTTSKPNIEDTATNGNILVENKLKNDIECLISTDNNSNGNLKCKVDVGNKEVYLFSTFIKGKLNAKTYIDVPSGHDFKYTINCTETGSSSFVKIGWMLLIALFLL